MKSSTITQAIFGAALLAAVAAPAHAELTVLDAWQLATPNTSVGKYVNLPGVPTLTTNIGYLSLDSGSATVEQQLNSSGQTFVGAVFHETGAIYTVRYVANTTTGPNDTAAPDYFGDSLTINFTNVVGQVSSVNTVTGGFGYVFTSGSFSISDPDSSLATGSIVGIGGNTGSTPVVGGVNGDSTLLANVLTAAAGFDLRNSSGTSLLPSLASGSVFFEATTNNLVSGNVLNTSTCSFNGSAQCATFTATSAGQAYLVQNSVPEPGSIALVGLALGGFGLTRLGGKKRSS